MLSFVGKENVQGLRFRLFDAPLCRHFHLGKSKDLVMNILGYVNHRCYTGLPFGVLRLLYVYRPERRG